MEKAIRTLGELEAKATRFARGHAAGELRASLVTLQGELGAGKTAFTQAVARALDVTETVTSPTFVLEKIYLLNGRQFKRLIHIDAYRLEKAGDLAPLGFDELVQDAGNLILLEWPEKVSDALPIPAVRISFVAHTDGSRTITYD